MARYQISRSIQIDVPQQRVFETVADFNSWTTWSPWLCAEPSATVTVTDNHNSVGAIYAWQGDVVGSGEIEHKHLESPRYIEEDLRFLKPFKSRADVNFEIKPVGDGTLVTWGMHGNLPWYMFWMRPMLETFMQMDYDRGLKMLKQWLETGHIESRIVVQGTSEIGPLQMLGVRRSCPVAETESSMDQAFREAKEIFERHNLNADATMISVYHKFNMTKGIFHYTSGYIVDSLPPQIPSGLSSWSLPATQVFRVDHIGSYEHLGNAWSAANAIARHKKLKQTKVGTFEIYRTTPADTPSAEVLTEIYLPIK